MRHDDLARMLPRLRPWRWLATALLLLGLGGSWLVAPGQAATGPVRTPTALGTILAWGSDHAGQLGDGTVEAPDNWPVPQPVPGFDNVVAVSTGAQFSLALRADGSVWAWGYDGVGQLGDGTVGSPPAQPTPQPVPGIADAVAIAAGGFHSLALRTDGTVWAWGYDEYAQLGDGIVGGPNAQPAPRQVPGLTNVVAVSAGILVSLALTDDGTIWAWGIDFAASLDAGRRFQPTPQPVAGLTGVVAVSAGIRHALALRSDGTVWAWGSNEAGQLGLGMAGTPLVQPIPQRVPGPTDVVAIGAGATHSLALTDGGNVWFWGEVTGETKTAPAVYQPAAQAIPDLRDVVAISAGAGRSLAVVADGSVLAWGDNLFEFAQPVSGGDAVGPRPVPGLNGAIAVSAGVEHALALVAPTGRYFPETGQTVGPPFLAYWEAHGGLAINGYPLSPAFTQTLEDGKAYLVQYFERVRLEYHPENPPPYDVLLGQFGRRLHPADPPVPPRPGYTYFDQSGHNVSARFLAYWDANGGLAQFGLPISEEFTETLEDGKPYLVQYFERARFEHHPENAPPYDVLLGQFGRRIMEGTPSMPEAPSTVTGKVKYCELECVPAAGGFVFGSQGQRDLGYVTIDSGGRYTLTVPVAGEVVLQVGYGTASYGPIAVAVQPGRTTTRDIVIGWCFPECPAAETPLPAARIARGARVGPIAFR